MNRRHQIVRNPIAFVWSVVLVCCLVILTFSILRLPEIQLRSYPASKTTKQSSHNDKDKFSIGKFGDMMIEMLPEDLAFTVFLPSEKAFQRDLKLNPNDSFGGEKMNDTYAVISRVLGFSAVPRTLTWVNMPIDKELSYDSISGFVLYISKDEDGGRLVVNGVRSTRVDLRKKGSVVHVMDGVIMDAEFQQSVQTDDNEQEN